MKFNEIYANIKNYEAGKPIELVIREFGIHPDDIIKLASNENPRGCSPKVLKALQESCSLSSLYPDDSMFELKEGLAKRFDVAFENIIIGAGSDQVIDFAIRTKTHSKSAILTAGITFAMYEIYAHQVGSKVIKTPSDMHNLDEFRQLYKKYKDEISIIFLCLPNNPLGECLDKDEVYSFIKEIDKDVLVIVDGAYQEYAKFKDKAKSIEPKDLLNTFENALYLGTFSKAYGLGGLRCGYGIASNDIIQTLHKCRPPFNITSLSLKAAVEALRDEKFVQECLEENLKELKKYENFANKMSIDYIDSYTNFITLKLPTQKNSTQISDLLLKKGIIVRNLASYGMNAIRVTIGKPRQNKKFFEVFEEIYM